MQVMNKRTNYTEPTVSIAGVSYGEGGARARARETISDKRVWPGKNRNRKKALPKAVRDALVYRKNFATLLEESVRLFDSKMSCRNIYSVHMHYTGHPRPPTRCADLSDRCRSSARRTTSADMHRLRLLGQLQVYAMLNGVLRHELSRHA